MASRTVPLRYGRERFSICVPESARVLEAPEIPALPDPRAEVRRVLAAPTGTPPLRELIRAQAPKNAVITISDFTRPVPNELLVGELLDALNAEGVPDANVTVLIATGMHRASSPREREEMLGRVLKRACRVVDHLASDAASVVRVSAEPPVSVNRLYVDADFKIVTGLIEPHFMAGFSGGRKGICPGLVDLATIQRFHGYKTMGDPLAENGLLDGNPCHAEALRVARIVGCDFLLNAAIAHNRRPAGIYGGHLEAAHLAGCRQVGLWNGVLLDETYDLVVTNAGGYPLDATYYQTVKGMCAALPALHERSTLLIASACSEGIGSPEYTATMQRWGRDWRGFLEFIARSGVTTKDQWQYQMQARVLARIGAERLCLVSDGLEAGVQAGLSVHPVTGAGGAAERTQAFVDAYLREHPRARIAVIPEGPYAMLVAPQSVAVAGS
ncbi:MAG: nickel-dependent lactate racemase [Planctomycetes bacterium]|nr:nickel-dependent lactate racemase [Planctomycetota bacterium]